MKSMGWPEKVEHDERRRVERLRSSARSGHARVHISNAKKLENSYGVLGGVQKAGVLGYSNAIVAGDVIRRKILRREEFEAMQGTPVIHVKDGKPLTEIGARILGVPWEDQR